MDFDTIADNLRRSGNTVIGAPKRFDDSDISVQGENNILYFSPESAIDKTSIRIHGSNSVFFLGGSTLRADIDMGTGSVLYIGSDDYFHPTVVMKFNICDDSMVLFGDQVLSSLAIAIDTEHPGNNIQIGSHSWLCQGCRILGNSVVSKDTIVGAMTTIRDFETASYSVYVAENRLSHSDVIFSAASLRNMERDELLSRNKLPEKEYLGFINMKSINFRELEELLQNEPEPEKRLDIIKEKSDANKYEYVAVTPFEKSFMNRLSRKFFKGENRIIGDYEELNSKSRITFTGTNNTLIIEPGVSFKNVTITFSGNNGLVYLSRSDEPYRMKISTHENCTVFFGSNNRFNSRGKRCIFNAADMQSIIVGNGSTFEKGMFIRTSDQHGLYDKNTRERINYGAPVIIDDDAYIGNNSFILKGVVIGKGETVDPDSFIFKSRSTSRYSGYAKRLSAAKNMSERINILKEIK